MRSRVYLFFAFLMGGIFVSAWLLEPHSRPPSEAINTAQIEFERYRYYEISAQGVERIMIAQRGWHYADHEEIEGPILIQRNRGVTEGLSAMSARWFDNRLHLFGQVHYWNSRGYNLLTEEAVYNRANEQIVGMGRFSFDWAAGQMTGEDFVIDARAETFEAQKIHAYLWPNRI